VTEFTTSQYERMFGGDPSLAHALSLTFIYVFSTLAIFNVTFGLILALVTTSIGRASGAFFRSVWLLPRMSPSVLYILLWIWVINPSELGLLNQILMTVFGLEKPIDPLSTAPVTLIVIANGFIGASLGMVIFTSAIRGIPEHLFHAARADGAGPLAIVRHITLPALRWPISFVTIYQTLSLLVSFEYILLLTGGGPFNATTVYALFIYRRAFESGQYAYGAALSLLLIIIGVVLALFGWRFFDMRKLLQRPRIEVH
jgi:inositol-phosphate transport system permease protein